MCKKVLIVEDFDEQRFLIERMINKKFNLEYMGVASADEALALLDTFEFYCVITDISMPFKSGHHVVRYAIKKGIPVIVTTGYEPNMSYVDKKAFACFLKPINWDNFEATLRELCKMQDLKEVETA